MEIEAVWTLLADRPWWHAGAAAGLLAALVGVVVLPALARRRAAAALPLDADSTLDDGPAGFRTSRFAARVCSACSQPMLLEGDGRWRCAGHPACRG